MAHEPIDDLVDELSDLVDAERKAILAADFATIERLFDAKEALINKIRDLSSADDLKHLDVHQKLMRNQELLTAAMQGIRTVADRLSALRQVKEGLHTYDARGQRNRYRAVAPKTLEKRA